MRNTIENVLSRIKGIKGVHRVFILTDEDKKKILELEKPSERRMMMGCLYDNQGVKDALKCNVVVAFLTDMEYEWPQGPNLILTWKGIVIGEEISAPEKLEELKNSENAIVKGNFVLYKNRMLKSSPTDSEPPVIVMPPKSCILMEKIPNIHNVIQGAPSRPVDNYLKKSMGVDLKDRKLGTFLLGFNVEE